MKFCRAVPSHAGRLHVAVFHPLLLLVVGGVAWNGAREAMMAPATINAQTDNRIAFTPVWPPRFTR
jgi:hypothetical protein